MPEWRSNLAPSDQRVSPRCALHRRCGGCQIQAMDYEAQLAYKQNKVRGNLIRIGGFSEELVDQVMLPIVGMEEPYRYRNKAQFPIGRDQEGRLVAGFYASRTHQIIPVTDCVLGVAQNREILDCVLAYMEENHIEPYDEKTGKGLVRHVLIRYGFSTYELMVCVVINGEQLPARERLIERLCRIAGMTISRINQNTKNTNVILGDVTKTIWGQAYITDYIHLRSCETGTFAPTGGGDQLYHISHSLFIRSIPCRQRSFNSLVLDYAGLTGREIVWDLYCGIDDLVVSGTEGGEGLRRGGRTAGDHGCAPMRSETASQTQKFLSEGRRTCCRSSMGEKAGAQEMRRRKH